MIVRTPSSIIVVRTLITMYKFFKRFFDLILSFIFLFLISPFFIFVILLQVLFNGLPIFYLGIRTGKNNHKFKIIKFRTMIKNAENIGGFTTAKNDNRITIFGRFLRSTKIDEIPQLINIIRGDMSFVGPRPEVPFYTDMYKDNEKRILSVRPGITDYSSIKFINLADEVGSNNADQEYLDRVFTEKNILRLKYVDDMSFRTDISIFFITIIKVMKKFIYYSNKKR